MWLKMLKKNLSKKNLKNKNVNCSTGLLPINLDKKSKISLRKALQLLL